MKRVDLIRAIEAAGAVLVRNGRRYDWYRNPATGAAQPVPRHREINEHLARSIIARLSPPPPPAAADEDEPEPGDSPGEPGPAG